MSGGVSTAAFLLPLIIGISILAFVLTVIISLSRTEAEMRGGGGMAHQSGGPDWYGEREEPGGSVAGAGSARGDQAGCAAA